MKEMKKLCDKCCIIGEGPIWNEREGCLYFTNGFGNEICKVDITTGALQVRSVPVGVAAFAFDRENRMIISRDDGVFILNDDDTLQAIYDTSKYTILYANDMKVGPDGRIYVGTQSGKRKGVSNQVDGRLYSIAPDGTVRVLLEGLILSNGMEWSMDEKRFYHTDSDTHVIREYSFDKHSGEIAFTGRELVVPGVDGFTMDQENRILAACWGQGHIAVIDTKSMEITDYIAVPAQIPASCAFAGNSMNLLVVTTASYGANLEEDPSAGFVFAYKTRFGGRKPYTFGG